MYFKIEKSPLCLCGCGNEVIWDKWRKKYNKYLNGHNPTKGGVKKGKKNTKQHNINISKGKKGIPNLKAKGVPRADETKKKISEKHKGKSTGRGEFSRNWQGGKTAEYRLRNAIEHRLWRESVFARDNWTCQKCYKRGVLLNAHHIKKFSKYPELRTSLENGITLCQECHKEEHKRKR